MFVFDGDEIIKHTHRLDQLHRAALPNAIRFTLNGAAFQTKKLIPDFADDNFINRKPTFFKRFSGVEQARGFDISKMSASVGMIIDPNVQSTEDIEIQETGGSIERTQIMLPDSRVSRSENKLVSKKYKGQGFKHKRRAAKSKDFVRGAMASQGNKNPDHLRYEDDNGKGYIIEVTKVTKLKRGGLKIKSRIIASFDPKRKLNISKRPFVQPAAMEAAKDLNKLFRQNAAKQIKKFS